MNEAKPGDWKTEPLPAKRATIRLDRWFSSDEMNCIRKGVVPAQMEDKWFIYWKDNTLFLHRSWTGFCIYVIRFAVEDGGWRMVEADLNRDPEQYAESKDERDAEVISDLIDVLLLHRPAAPGQLSGESVLASWSRLGRAMLGQHPDVGPAKPSDRSGRGA